MIAPKLNSNGDLDFDQETGTFNTVDGDDEVRQALYLLMGTNIGELPWNEDIGLNHMDVFINADDQSVVQTIITDYLRDQLGESFDTFEITSFTADKLNRITSLVGTVTIDGEAYTEQVALAQSDTDEGAMRMPIDDKVGYVRPELDDLREQVNQLWFDEYGDGIDMQDNQISGMFAGVMASQWDKLEQVAQGVCNAMLVLSSKGANLDDRAADNQISRNPETYASVELQITGYLQASIPEGTEFSTDSGIVFVTAAEAIISQQATTTDDNGTSIPLVDDDGDALGQVTVAANALEPGVDSNVMPNTVINPEEAIDGFSAVTNPNAAVGGTAAETDQELQLRIISNRISKPNSTDSGIETAIKNVAGVRDAHIVSNRTMTTDEYGNPAKSAHLYVIGGADEDIAAAYLHYRPLLSNTVGSIAATATDVGGKVKTINFDRAQTVPVFISISLKVDGTVFDSDSGPITIKQNIINYFETLTMGDGVPYSKMFGPAYSTDGVKDVSVALGTTAADAKEQDITVSTFQLAVTSTDSITVNVEGGELMFHTETPLDDTTWTDDITSSLPAVLNQAPDSNNQRVLRIIAAYTNDVKNEILHLSEQTILENMAGKFLTDYAKDWGVTRIDDDDAFLKFQVRLQQLKGRLGVTDDDFKLLIATVLDIDVSSFDVVSGDDPETVKVLNLPFNFTDNKQEIKRKILTDSLQQMLPVEYLLVEVQFQTISDLDFYVGVVGQTRTITKSEMTNLRSKINHINRHIYVGAAAQQFRITDAPLKGAD